MSPEALAEMPADHLKPGDLRLALDKISSRPVMQNSILRLFKASMRSAAREEMVPSSAVDRMSLPNQQATRDRVLAPHEIVAVWRATWKVHDLRRTCATNLGELAIPDEVVSLVLGHTKKDVTGRVYNLSQRLPELAAALNKWAGRIERLLAETPELPTKPPRKKCRGGVQNQSPSPA